MPRRAVIVGVAIFVGTAALVALLLWAIWSNQQGGSGKRADASIVNQAVLDGLPKKDASGASMKRVADTVQAPTNSWISGLALQENPQAVFPMPGSFQALNTGFQIGLPTIVSESTVITGGHTPSLTTQIESATTFKITRFDKVSAKLTYFQNNDELGQVTIAQGSPYTFYRAARDSTLIIRNANGVTEQDGVYRFRSGDADYVVAPHGSSSVRSEGSQLSISVPSNQLVTFYSLPSGAQDALREFSGNELASVDTRYEKKGDRWETKLTYTTENKKPTAVSFLPYNDTESGNKMPLVYKSTYGNMAVYSGAEFVTSSPLVQPKLELSAAQLTEQEKDLLRRDLQADSVNTAIQPQDTYFAGKQLARLANLLSLAQQLEEKDVAVKLQGALKEELSKRLGASYFYYDTQLKGVAAQQAAFGSEEFNDHHFHYGYFIYASAILARYDDDFLNEYKDEVNLLVADIASYETYDSFPKQRYYDAYSAHSWAAGLSPFQDGNNQESSSEAMNAWNAVALWGRQIKNTSLSELGEWMLAGEAKTASEAWRSVDTSDVYLKGYTSPVASLSFGGKRTYSTFFSDESNAKLGIQLIPMSPFMEILKEDGGEIKQKLAAQTSPSNYNVALGDYLLMYLALTDKDEAIRLLESQQDEFIDDGNSRTYLRAWIYTR